LSPEEKAAKKEQWLKGKDQRNADNNQNRHRAQEEQIVAEEEAKKAAMNDPLPNAAAGELMRYGSNMKETDAEEQPLDFVVEAAAQGIVAKANKTYACTEKGSQILAMYLSPIKMMPTKENQAKEKCMRAQMNQHCMPYEKFDATYIEPCSVTDFNCMQRRVVQDHPNCINKHVDWDSIQNYAQASQKGMMQVLGEWCSHIKLLKEIQRRVALDEEFLKAYPAVLMLDDTVMLDKEWTEEVTKDWVNNQKRAWDLVQLDSYGGKSNQDKIGEFRGKAIFRPSWKANYGGFHATLIKTASINQLLEKMQGLNVIPFEWVSKSMNDDPKGLEILTWEGGVSTVAWQASQPTKNFFLPKACTIR